MTLTGAGVFTLLFAEAVRAPRVGMIVPRVMLAQQVLAVVVAVRGAHDRVDMIAGGLVVRIDDSWLMVEFARLDCRCGSRRGRGRRTRQSRKSVCRAGDRTPPRAGFPHGPGAGDAGRRRSDPVARPAAWS